MKRGDELIRQSEVARTIGVTNSAVNQKMDAGHLAFETVGGVRFVPRWAMEQWQKERAERARKLTELL